MTVVHVVVPSDIDDPARPSGGNIYDRRILRGLDALGWSVREHAVPGRWPRPDAAACAVLAALLAGLPDGSMVLLDGLIASAAAGVLVPQAGRLRQMILVHLPLDEPGECEVLAAATAVVATSGWTRRWLLARYPIDPARVHVAEPGTDPAPLAPGTVGAGELLCVGPVARHKGHDVLVAALTAIAHLPWRCVCVGSLEREPEFVDGLRRTAVSVGLGDRLRFAGVLTGADLDAAYAGADVLVHPSRGETYGMVIAEALARGLPVIASDVGGIAETMGGRRPGLLVPVADSAGLGAALATWLTDEAVRIGLRDAARDRRTTLRGWSDPVERVARVLAGVAS